MKILKDPPKISSSKQYWSTGQKTQMVIMNNVWLLPYSQLITIFTQFYDKVLIFQLSIAIICIENCLHIYNF